MLYVPNAPGTALGILLILCSSVVHAQSFSYWLSGNADDVETAHQPGLVLAGGGGDNDDAMRWMLQRAAGGDVVVLRASGSDGYNTYFFSELGVAVDSVETIRFDGPAAAEDPFVLDVIAGAEVLFLAGGNQTDYVDYWVDTSVSDLFTHLQHTKRITLGGTSAGMAILGQVYYAPVGAGVTSSEALADPFHPYLANVVTDAPLFDYPWLAATVTDTHYDQRDRRGRHLVFLAKAAIASDDQVFGIAANEYTAVAIEPNGIARVFGEYPQYDDYAYFLQSGCGANSGPELLQPGVPVDWNRHQRALTVYRIGGTTSASGYLNLNNWRTGSGGSWFHWWADNGVLKERPGVIPQTCTNIGPDKTIDLTRPISLGQTAGAKP